MEGMAQKTQAIADRVDEAQAMPSMGNLARPRPGYAGRALMGVPFLLLAMAPLMAFSPEAVMRSFVLTTIAVFTVHMPVVAGIYGLHEDEQAGAPLPRAAYLWLLLLWAMTNWAQCLLWR